MDTLLRVIGCINEYLSDYVLLFLLIGAGLCFSWRTRFVQVRCLGEGFRNVFGTFSLNGKSRKGGLSPFQALTAAVAAQVGTGNIVGAAGAVITGGPGAIFWMWIIAFLGMATIYAEAVLAQNTKVTEADGNIHGGPVYYIKKAFPNWAGRFMAVFFAAATVIGVGFTGCMVQANAIGAACHDAFGVPSWVIGVLLALAGGAIFMGGVTRLAKVTEKLVPAMAILYLAGGFYILAMRWQYLPETFWIIIKYAFDPAALIGGSIGYALKTAVSQGAKRGLFSNEAGMGTTPHAHAAARGTVPHVQGTVAMIGVFIDTAVVLTMTSFIIISVFYVGDGPLALADGSTYSGLLAANGLTQTNLVAEAVASVTTVGFGRVFVAVCLLFFAFSTIISWNYFGRINMQYLFGQKSLKVYSLIAVLCIFAGTLLKSDLVWALQDMCNQLIVLPNIAALLVLGRIVAEASKQKEQ